MATVSEILRGLGEPSPAPFQPAPFQQAALDALASGDVLVSAPTGSGKTWIAEQEIARLLLDAPGTAAAAPTDPRAYGVGQYVRRPRVWYTAPLKALSNQKFRRFQGLYGEASVGLLTGERRINPRAPVIVATTEILRNAFYDAPGAAGGIGAPPEVVVLDEAHYLADPERGTAWEEILLLAPPPTRLLLLSATVPNAHELADWMATVRGRPPEVITLDLRPVPLAYLLADGDGRLHAPEPHRIRTRRRHPRWLLEVADALGRHQLTPAILFFPSRRECDEAARVLGGRPSAGEAERAARLDAWLERVPQLAAHPLLPALRRGGVAAHHAGHLTGWRMCVEELLEVGLVRMVCATTTLAAGLDVPARTVVLSTLHRHGPEGPEPLTPTEFHQMTGRAGRRGRDTLGVAVIAAPFPDDAHEGLALAGASPDPVRSAFTPSDAQVLNLLARSQPDVAETMLRRSFAAFLRRTEIAAARERLAALPPDPLVERPCDDRLSTRARFEDLLGQLRRARRGPQAADDVARLGRELVEVPCAGCHVTERCLATLGDLRAVERTRRQLAGQVDALEDQEVGRFRTRAGVLRDLGYLDEAWRPTLWGEVAVRIRHPRMLVLAEALRAKVFPDDPEALAAVAGALGTERVAGLARLGALGAPRGRGRGGAGGWDRRSAMGGGGHRHGPGRGGGPGARYDSGVRSAAGRHGTARRLAPPGLRWSPADDMPDRARGPLGALRRLVMRLNRIARDAGLPPDPLEGEFTGDGREPAAALWRAALSGVWASGIEWEGVIGRYGVPDGDLQRLVWQAAEILVQIEDFPQSPLVAAAREARETMLRPPVL